MTDIYLGLGSNLGDKEQHIRHCLSLLEQEIGALIQCSSFYYSAPEGFESENDFVNVVAHFETSLSPLQLLEVTQEVERKMGRVNKSKSGEDGTMIHFDRVIDIDILYYGDLKEKYYDAQENEILIIPHPHMQKRAFVMTPLQEILHSV